MRRTSSMLSASMTMRLPAPSVRGPAKRRRPRRSWPPRCSRCAGRSRGRNSFASGPSRPIITNSTPPPFIGRGRAEPERTGAYPSMNGDERQWPLERLAQGIEELKTVLGAGSAARVDRVKHQLIEAMAARDRGDRTATLAAIAGAMAELASLGDGLDAAEGAMMRSL